MAPIILFIYNRPEHTLRTLEALESNTLSQSSELFIFADGAKKGASAEQIERINETRKVAKSRKWCGTVTIYESEENKGLSDSIIGGVTKIINDRGSAIILEDDIVTGKHFLEFMNDALERYKDSKEVWHITAWRDPVRARSDAAFFYPNMDCWGWATWKDRWQHYEKNPEQLKATFTPEMIKRFNMDGSEGGNWWQVEENLAGRMNTWAIFWLATIFLRNGLCLAPTKSLVRNIGLDNSGVHCGNKDLQSIKGSIDHRVTRFPSVLEIDEEEYEKTKEFKRILNGCLRTPLVTKIKRRIKRVIKNLFPKKFGSMKI